MAALEAARTAAEGAAALQVQQAEERKRRQEVEAIFRMMDTDSDGYLSVEVSPPRKRVSQCLSAWGSAV
jgi:hypothetical protein